MNVLHGGRRRWSDSLVPMQRSTPRVTRFPSNLLLLPTLFLLLVACSSGPEREISVGETLLERDFSESNSFEEGIYTNASLRIDDGRYLIRVNSGDSEIWWGQWGDTLDNVVIDVDVEQISEREEAAWGVACRLRGQVGQKMESEPLLELLALGEAGQEDDGPDVALEPPAVAAIANGDGYLFLIQGSGNWGIFRARGRDVFPLSDWTASDLVQRGPGARNHLRAVCADDYLAFYINEEFVAEVEDNSFANGQVGLAATSFNRLGVEVGFENLVVSEAISG